MQWTAKSSKGRLVGWFEAFAALFSERELPEETYKELVKLLFENIPPALVMAILFTSNGILASVRLQDTALNVALAIGIIIGFGRVASMLIFRVRHKNARDLALLKRWECWYAAGSLGFAAALGVGGQRVFASGDIFAQLLYTGLIFGYGSGAVSRASIRPWICIPSLCLAVFPCVVALFGHGDPNLFAHGALMLIFVVASFESVRHLHAAALDQLLSRRAQAAIARHDTLTGLPNRLYLDEYLAVEAAHPVTSEALFSVFYLDLDKFKEVNDTYGHNSGDALLKAVARRISACLKAGDFVARVGGDEFVIVQGNVRAPSETEMLARRLLRELSDPFILDGIDVQIGASIGLTLISQHPADPESILAEADLALYKAKSRGRRNFCVYTPNETDDHRFLEAARA